MSAASLVDLGVHYCALYFSGFGWDVRVATVPSHLLALPGGRRTAYCDGGDPDGYPVIALHGTPGCRLSRWPDESVYARAGVRYITFDRAGYGQASRNPGRTVADEAADVLAVADGLGLERFAVTGGSGGGPGSLACGALLAGRVQRVACQSGLAPYGAAGLPHDQWLAGQTAENVEEVDWALAGQGALVRGLTGRQRDLEDRIATDPEALFGADVTDVDREIILRPEVVEVFRCVFAEQAAHGVYGWVDDTLSQIHPWGFDLAAIGVPVLLTYGLADAFVPPQHGRWLAAHLPTAQVEVSPEGGHLIADPDADIVHVLSWLRDPADS
jgi:pimeloyl-ACP methyl ester carboxylesterase